MFCGKLRVVLTQVIHAKPLGTRLDMSTVSVHWVMVLLILTDVNYVPHVQCAQNCLLCNR